MSNSTIFSPRALREYIEWQTEDGKTLKKINELIRDIQRNGYTGIGHPELLKGDLSGYCSREINQKDRIIYTITDANDIEIIQCKGHYSDR